MNRYFVSYKLLSDGVKAASHHEYMDGSSITAIFETLRFIHGNDVYIKSIECVMIYPE